MTTTIRPDDHGAKRNESRATERVEISTPITTAATIVKPAAKKVYRTTKRRVVLASLFMLILLVVAGSLYLALRPSVRPLAMPSLPSHLSWEQLGLSGWQEYQQPLPAHPLDNPALPRTPQIDKNAALLEDAAGQALIQQGQLERGIAYLKAAVLATPDNLRTANDLRLELRDHQRYAEEEGFFTLLAKKLNSPNVQLSMALTYVDEMRSCPKPPDGLVCQAQDSSRSISVLNGILDKNPYNIVARYARGLNDLYWPTLMGHLPQAQVDLQYAVALTRIQQIISPTFTPQAYTALGDVFAKSGKIDEARNVWLNGLGVCAQKTLLQSRLNIPQDRLVSEEDQSLRGLGVYVDTDLATFWQKGR